MIDLDAVIAAEVIGDPIEVTVGGDTYRLLAEMPWETAKLIGKDDAFGALASLVHVDDNEPVDDDGLTEAQKAFARASLVKRPTLMRIARRMNAIYASGESSASPRSSTNGGKRSRPTSKGSTGSTSAAP